MNEFVLSSEILTEFEFSSPKEYKVNAIVLLVENSRLKDNGYNLSLYGKQMKEWVKDSLSHFDVRFVSLTEKDNAFEVIKPFIKDEDYTIVLYSDTPLLKSATVLDALDYATTKQLDFCKLPRGFIIASQNFKNNKVENSAEPAFIDKEDFFAVFDCKTLSVAEKQLKNKILDKHLKNKVIIHDVKTTYIDSQVEIAPFVEIYAGNTIKGNTIIEKDVVLQENNVIENSRIKKGTKVLCSVLKNTQTKPDSFIGPFEYLKDNKGEK